MSHAKDPPRGRLLENAVGTACVRYEREKRAFVKKNATPMRYRQGEWKFTEKADADYTGPISGGGFFAGECKEVHDDLFEIFNERAGLKDHQRARLEKAARLDGAVSGLVLGFLGRSPWEVYFIHIVNLVPFLDAPWRRSVTPLMARAWGLLLPLAANPAGRPMVRFLDGAPHPLKDAAIAHVNADRLAHPYELPLTDDLGLPIGAPRKMRKERPMTGRGSAFDLLEVAKDAKRRGVKGKRWGDR